MQPKKATISIFEVNANKKTVIYNAEIDLSQHIGDRYENATIKLTKKHE